MSQSARILVVDDTHENIMVLHSLLDSQGYHVLIAEDGAAAMEIIRYEPLDLILLDVMLPDCNGFEICRRLKRQAAFADIPVIFITALTNQEKKSEGFKAGGVDYITKPFDYDDVLMRTRTHLQLAQTRRRLQDSELQLQTVINNAAVCISLLSVDGVYRHVNHKCCEFFGYRAEELLGLRCLSLNHPEYYQVTDQALTQLRLGELDNFHLDKKFVRKNGEFIWGSHWLQALRNDQGECEGFVCVIADLSERKAFEATLAEKNAALTQLNQEKNEFLGIAAHDLKNPLSGILNMAELLKAHIDAKDEDAQEYIALIDSSAQKMFNLINNLLDVNLIESGDITINLDTYNISPLLQKITQQFQFAARKKAIQLELAMPEQAVFALTHAQTLSQILDNLISNAIKYSPSHSVVALSVIVHEQHIEICVRDQGPGFTEQDKQNLFGKFARLSAKPTAGEHSTGLGLFIVKKLCDNLNTRVVCDSESGKGSCFRLLVPSLPNQNTISTPVSVCLEAEDKFPALDNANTDFPSMSPALLQALQPLIPQWQTLDDTASINAIEAFAKITQDLARQHQYPPLENWATALLHHTRHFDLDNMLKTLEYFGALIKE
jgi:PAS domain S-box-containing protein